MAGCGAEAKITGRFLDRLPGCRTAACWGAGRQKPTWGFGLTTCLAAAVLMVDGLAGQRVHADLRHTYWRLLHVTMETQDLSSVCRVLHHLHAGRLTGPQTDLFECTCVASLFFFISPETGGHKEHFRLAECNPTDYWTAFPYVAFSEQTGPGLCYHWVDLNLKIAKRLNGHKTEHDWHKWVWTKWETMRSKEHFQYWIWWITAQGKGSFSLQNRQL